MKIFGIGISRTGTGSLYYAMREMGFKSFHYVTNNQWKELHETEKFDFINDMPIYARYQELDERWPGSKFIYTYRDVEDWLNSAKHLWTKQRNALECDSSNFRTYTEEFFGVSRFDEEAFKTRFWTHHEEVHNYFEGRDDLLPIDLTVGNDKEKWRELSRFVGAKGGLPTIPFPHRNRGIKGR